MIIIYIIALVYLSVALLSLWAVWELPEPWYHKLKISALWFMGLIAFLDWRK